MSYPPETGVSYATKRPFGLIAPRHPVPGPSAAVQIVCDVPLLGWYATSEELLMSGP